MNPSGLCKCGCGKLTSIARYTWALRGYVAGQPKDYIVGHNQRKPDRPRTRQEKKQAAKEHGPPRAGQTNKAKAVARHTIVKAKGRWW